MVVLGLTEFQTVMLYASLPTAGALFGTALAEVVNLDDRRMVYAIHLAAGTVLAVIAVDLVPEGLEGLLPWQFLVAFAVGALSFVAMDLARERMGGERGSSPWVLVVGIGVDLVTDGLTIGAGFEVEAVLGLILGLGFLVVTVPEGFSSLGELREAGMPRGRRLGVMVAFSLSILVGAAAGYWVLRDVARVWSLGVLAWTAGVLSMVVVEEMTPEAHKHGQDRVASLLLLLGFLLYTAVSTFVA